MTISNEAVEAAANAISECSGMRFDGFWSRVEDLEPEDREYALTEARAALEAAAPIIRAEAAGQWAEAMDKSANDLVQSWGEVPMSVTASATLAATRYEARRLRARAVAERGGE